MLVVVGIVLLALFLVATERLPIDTTAIFIIVVLTLLSPWTNISVTEGISGCSSTATIVVPREATIDDVASAAGIDGGTISEHLQRAERNVRSQQLTANECD